MKSHSMLLWLCVASAGCRTEGQAEVADDPGAPQVGEAVEESAPEARPDPAPADADGEAADADADARESTLAAVGKPPAEEAGEAAVAQPEAATPDPEPAKTEPQTVLILGDSLAATGFGALLEKSVGPKVEGAVTRILLWKTDGPVAHKQHWWLILEASSPEGATGWFQLDLTLADGPRVLWGAGAHKANSVVQQVAVPDGLTSGAVVDAARGVAATAYHYNPAALPQPTDYPRYSCQNFVRDVAARTGIAL